MSVLKEKSFATTEKNVQKLKIFWLVYFLVLAHPVYFGTHMYAHNTLTLIQTLDTHTYKYTDRHTHTHREYLWTVFLATGVITETSYLAHLCTYALVI